MYHLDSVTCEYEPPTKKSKTHKDLTQEEPQPGCSSQSLSGISKPNTSFPVASPEILVPIPLIKQNVIRNKRRKGKTAILTKSSYRNELEVSIEKKRKSDEEKEKKKNKQKESSRKKSSASNMNKRKRI